MRIAAHQFPVSGDIRENLSKMLAAMKDAADRGAGLLLFPECALTGYPPLSVESSAEIDYACMQSAVERLQALAVKLGICIVYGTAARLDGKYFNTAVIQMPDGEQVLYHKRALWGWDSENFTPGNEKGVFELNGMRIGVRICYELRFPEYFRELYRSQTDLNLLLFYDTAQSPDDDRYELLQAHIRTRASENLCPILSANAVSPHQTAPTMLADSAGKVLCELARDREGMLLWDLEPEIMDFSRRGRKAFSDKLAK